MLFSVFFFFALAFQIFCCCLCFVLKVALCTWHRRLLQVIISAYLYGLWFKRGIVFSRVHIWQLQRKFFSLLSHMSTSLPVTGDIESLCESALVPTLVATHRVSLLTSFTQPQGMWERQFSHKQGAIASGKELGVWVRRKQEIFGTLERKWAGLYTKKILFFVFVFFIYNYPFRAILIMSNTHMLKKFSLST